MNEEDRMRLFQKAADIMGIDTQIAICIEENSEVQKELCKYLRHIGNTEHLTEEIADAMQMLEEIIYIFHIDKKKIHEIIDIKMKKLEEILKQKVLNITLSEKNMRDTCDDCGVLFKNDDIRNITESGTYCGTCCEKHKTNATRSLEYHNPISGMRIIYYTDKPRPILQFLEWCEHDKL